MNDLRHPTRRTVLRGLGTSIALPMLDAMSVAGADEGRGGSASAPARLVSIFASPYGPNNAKWYPSEFGAEYTLSPSLSPLQAVKPSLSVLTGLDYRQGGMTGHVGGLSFLTGVMLKNTHPYTRAPSIDTVAARHLGKDTRYRNLVMSPNSAIGPIGGMWAISVNEDRIPVAPLSNPRLLFNRLFVQQDADGLRRAEFRLKQRSSILDELLEQHRLLNKGLGRNDRLKMDEYLSSIRDIERQVASERAWLHRPKPTVEAPEEFSTVKRSDFLRLMLDIMFLTIQTDSCRVLTLSMGHNGDDMAWFEDLGNKIGWHKMQHHGAKPELVEALAKVDRIQVELLAHFLMRLQDCQEGDGNLLERTVVYYGSSMNNGEGLKLGKGVHGGAWMALLLAGGHGLGLSHGQHHDFRSPPDKKGNRQKSPPISNLFLTILRVLGSDIRSYGNSTGVLSELMTPATAARLLP